MKKLFYFIPAMLTLLFYLALAVVGGLGAISPWAWFWVAVLFLSALLLSKGRWYGCAGGFGLGCTLIYMSTRFTGQVIAAELPLGILFCLYYLVCGIVVYKKARR